MGYPFLRDMTGLIKRLIMDFYQFYFTFKQ